MENLLLSLQPDGNYKGFIIQYVIPEGQDFIDADTEINSIELDGGYDSGTILDELSRGSDCWVTDINSLGNNGQEYDDINQCYEDNGPEGCGRVVIHYGGGCPNVISPIPGDSSDAGGCSCDGGTNADSGGTGYDNGTLDGSEGNNEGSSGSGNEGGTTGEEGNDPNDNPETCFQDINGNCIGDTTAPITPIIKPKSTEQKNCEELQKLFATPNYPITPPAMSPKAAIAHLKSLISPSVDQNNDQERGYNLLHNSSLNASASWVNNTSSRSVRYRFSANNYGGCHLHPNDGKGHPFFSPEDILNLWKFHSTYNNGTPVDPSLFVHVLVSTNGVYAIKIDNPLFFQQLQAIYNDYKDVNQDGTDEVEKFAQPLEYAYEDFVDANTNFPNGSDSQYQRAFLKFMNNFDGNGTKIGISLYKANNDLSGWSKLTLNETTNIITPTPCN